MKDLSKRAHSQDHLGEARDYWWNEDYLHLLASRLSLKNCRSIADIGCGRGAMAVAMAPFLSEGTSFTGIDMERAHIKAARQKARSLTKKYNLDLTFEEGDAASIPLDDNSVDLAFCQTLLIHVANPEEVIREMQRITRPGGWIVALEPNNLATNLMFNRYPETDFNVGDMLQLLEVRLRCEQGRKSLGEGYSSLGDVLPDLFLQAQLEDIQVWMSDKAHQLIPPYDSREKRVRAAQLIDWLENDGGGTDYNTNLRYFKAGGGNKHEFDQYWYRASLYKGMMLRDLKEQKFVSAGGNVLYIVAGKKTARTY